MQLTGRTPHAITSSCSTATTRLDRAERCRCEIEEATSFTLFGTVVTGEQVGVEKECCDFPQTSIDIERQRIGLPLV